MSPSPACSSMAATRLPFSITASAVTAMAPPVIIAEREATAPKPGTSRSESPEVTVTISGAMPSRRAATLPNTVWCPCPLAPAPMLTLDRLAAGKRDARRLFRKGAGDLEIAADADAAQLAVLLRFLLARREAGIVGAFQRTLEHRGEIAAVVGVPERRDVGDFLRRDQVAPAQLGRVDAGLVGGGIDHAFEQIARFRTAGAAIGPGRHGVGEDATRVHLRQRNVVDRRQTAGDVQRDDEMADAGEIGAEIAEAVYPQRQEAAALVERKFDVPE